MLGYLEHTRCIYIAIAGAAQLQHLRSDMRSLELVPDYVTHKAQISGVKGWHTTWSPDVTVVLMTCNSFLCHSGRLSQLVNTAVADKGRKRWVRDKQYQSCSKPIKVPYKPILLGWFC